MGTDIHAVVEFQPAYDGRSGAPFEPGTGPVHELADGELVLDRNYPLFAALAGVRARPGQLPLIAPRGLPPVSSAAVKRLFFTPIVDDEDQDAAGRLGFSCITQDRAEEWVRDDRAFYTADRMSVSAPGLHDPGWLTAAELPAALAHGGLPRERWPAELSAAIAAMNDLAGRFGPDRVRLVFWFDS